MAQILPQILHLPSVDIFQPTTFVNVPRTVFLSALVHSRSILDQLCSETALFLQLEENRKIRYLSVAKMLMITG